MTSGMAAARFATTSSRVGAVRTHRLSASWSNFGAARIEKSMSSTTTWSTLSGKIRRRSQRDARAHRVPDDGERVPAGSGGHVRARARDDVRGERRRGEIVLVPHRRQPSAAEVQGEDGGRPCLDGVRRATRTWRGPRPTFRRRIRDRATRTTSGGSRPCRPGSWRGRSARPWRSRRGACARAHRGV